MNIFFMGCLLLSIIYFIIKCISLPHKMKCKKKKGMMICDIVFLQLVFLLSLRTLDMESNVWNKESVPFQNGNTQHSIQKSYYRGMAYTISSKKSYRIDFRTYNKEFTGRGISP